MPEGCAPLLLEKLVSHILAYFSNSGLPNYLPPGSAATGEVGVPTIDRGNRMTTC